MTTMLCGPTAALVTSYLESSSKNSWTTFKNWLSSLLNMKSTVAFMVQSESALYPDELPPIQTPKSRRDYIEIPNQILFHTDDDGMPILSDSNIRQGKAGDCYFLAALMAVAHSSPETILSIVRDMGDGTYIGSFYGLQSKKFWGEKNGKGSYVIRVNGDLPGKKGKPLYNKIENVDEKNVSWAAIIEKLWAAANKNNYSNIDGRGNSTRDDHDVQNGLFALTGIIPTEREISRLTFKQLQKDLAQGAVVVGTSTKRGKVTPDHALAVLEVDPSSQTVILGDPEKAKRPELDFKTFIDTNINQYFMVPLPR